MAYWTDLGLKSEPASEDDIRQAFANRLRQVRPDRDPDGFERLNAARDAAIATLRWRDAAERLSFADTVENADLPDRIYGDMSVLLRDRLAMLMNRPSDRLRLPNWTVLVDEGLRLPDRERALFRADYVRELMRLHGFYDNKAYRKYPEDRPQVFTHSRAKELLDMARLQEESDRREFHPMELEWLKARMGLPHRFDVRLLRNLNRGEPIPIRTWAESLAALGFAIGVAVYAALQS